MLTIPPTKKENHVIFFGPNCCFPNLKIETKLNNFVPFIAMPMDEWSRWYQMKYFKKITFLALLLSSNVWAQIGWGNVWRINVRFEFREKSLFFIFPSHFTVGLHKAYIQVNFSFAECKNPTEREMMHAFGVRWEHIPRSLHRLKVAAGENNLKLLALLSKAF